MIDKIMTFLQLITCNICTDMKNQTILFVMSGKV